MFIPPPSPTPTQFCLRKIPHGLIPSNFSKPLNFKVMALIKASANQRKIERAEVSIVSVINLPDSKCPVNKESGEVIPKSLLIDTEGIAYGVLTNRIKNLPVAFPSEGIKCNLSFENTTYTNKEGKEVEVSNFLSAEFNSKLRYVVENAKSVSVAGMD